MELAEPVVYSVHEFNERVNQTLDEQIGTVLVEGEITGFRVVRQQWVTFDLKDESSIVNCFASVYKIGAAFENGMTVRVLAKPRIYVPYGKYSLTIEAIQPIGSGAIQKAYALLVQKLTAEELFADQHKKSLPLFPERIGIITSPEGEALHDVRKILISRWGGFATYLYPVHVQGVSAAQEIIAAIHYFNERHPVDVIILTRGGGSMEDLLVFNDERVARSVFASRIPVVAAIGHERDITIAELVADVRAATPSHAAQVVVPDRQTVLQQLQQIETTNTGIITTRLALVRQKLSDITHVLRNHVAILTAHVQHRITLFHSRYSTLKQKLTTATQLLLQTQKDQRATLTRMLQQMRADIVSQRTLLHALNPTTILNRGYSFTINPESGTIVRSVAMVRTGQQIRTYVSDGNITGEVLHVSKENI